MRSRPLNFWIVLALLVAVASFVIDQNTGDTTGPPYDDPAYNFAAFLIFNVSAVAFLLLSVYALGRWVRRRSGRSAR